MRVHGLPEGVSRCLRRSVDDIVLGEYYKHDKAILVVVRRTCWLRILR